MTERFTLEYGTIKENDDVVIYEISRAQTNLIEPEQLEELKRDTPAFFKCQHYIVDEKFVRVLYKKESGYTKLDSFKNTPDELKKKITHNVLNAVEILGTQYTTLIHPANIYVNQEGQVKYAHRGIRSVLPPQELPLTQLLFEIKKVVIYLYTPYSFSELAKLDINKVVENNAFLSSVQDASSVNELKALIADRQPEQPVKTVKPIKSAQPQTVKGKKEKSGSIFAPIGFIVLGMALVAILMFLLLVNPQDNRLKSLSNQYSDELQSIKSEKGDLEEQIEKQRIVIDAYHAVVQDDPEQATSLFESMDVLDESDEITLIEQYFKLNTVESLTKIIAYDDSYLILAVEELVALDTDDANAVIQSIDTEIPEIMIEQAWIGQDYVNVIEIYETIPKNNRGKYLATLSYLEGNNPEKALSLANELKNKELQIASYQQEIALIEANKKLDKEEKKEALAEVNKKLEKVEK